MLPKQCCAWAWEAAKTEQIFFWRSEGCIDKGTHTSWRRYYHGLCVILISIYSFFSPAPGTGLILYIRWKGIVEGDI